VIKYRLRCARAHEFEAWFASSAACESQARNHQVCCPDCGSRDVAKAVMAPNLAGRCHEPERAAEPPEAKPQFAELVREVRRFLVARSEDVGAGFPEEARKIHYGEAEPRQIRGTASGEEARDLLDEGIEILAVPALPEDAN